MLLLGLAVYAAYGIVDARWIGGVDPAPHWLRHPQALNWMERILDAAALALYFVADSSVRAAWEERNAAAVQTLPVFPGAAQHPPRIDYGPFVISGSGQGESPGGLLLTRWWPPGLAHRTSVTYDAPPYTTSRAVMRWYERELGGGWEWKPRTSGVGGDRTGSILEGMAERATTSCSTSGTTASP